MYYVEQMKPTNDRDIPDETTREEITDTSERITDTSGEGDGDYMTGDDNQYIYYVSEGSLIKAPKDDPNSKVFIEIPGASNIQIDARNNVMYYIINGRQLVSQDLSDPKSSPEALLNLDEVKYHEHFLLFITLTIIEFHFRQKENALQENV